MIHCSFILLQYCCIIVYHFCLVSLQVTKYFNRGNHWLSFFPQQLEIKAESLMCWSVLADLEVSWHGTPSHHPSSSIEKQDFHGFSINHPAIGDAPWTWCLVALGRNRIGRFGRKLLATKKNSKTTYHKISHIKSHNIINIDSTVLWVPIYGP
jgi:hypothetical protein